MSPHHVKVWCLFYVSTSCWVWCLCFMSPHHVRYDVCVLCLHIMLGMVSMFYISTEWLPTNSGCSQHPCHPIEAVSRRVCFHFVHPPNSLPFFFLLTSYCLYFSSELHPVELSETSSGFLNYIQFPVSAASVKTIVSWEVCSLQRYVQNDNGHEGRWDRACRFLFIVPPLGIDPGLGTCQTRVLTLMALVPHCSGWRFCFSFLDCD